MTQFFLAQHHTFVDSAPHNGRAEPHDTTAAIAIGMVFLFYGISVLTMSLAGLDIHNMPRARHLAVMPSCSYS